jgi:hypothetical protein
MTRQKEQALWDIYRMIQNIPIKSGKLTEKSDMYTKFGIGLNDYDSARRLGLDNWVSIMDIIEKVWALAEDRPLKEIEW